MPSKRANPPIDDQPDARVSATIVLDYNNACIRVIGRTDATVYCSVEIRSKEPNRISYEWRDQHGSVLERQEGTAHYSSINARVRRIADRIPASGLNLTVQKRISAATSASGDIEIHESKGICGWLLLPRWIAEMTASIEEHRAKLRESQSFESDVHAPPDPRLARMVREWRKAGREDQRRAELQRRVQESTVKARAREQEKALRAQEYRHQQELDQAAQKPGLSRQSLQPVPEIPVSFGVVTPPRDDVLKPGGMAAFRLIQRASLLWISNQTDDLLCLPHCRIERLEYQQRTALKVLGSMRGRALLSDEVGLGKTIEAGLVLKECLTRGTVRRFLVLTLPSLIDQWREELDSKFGIRAITTHDDSRRDNAGHFWHDNAAIIASLHTIKQEAHLKHACSRPWDMLIVDEAHHLRNPGSKAWQAVNELPRHFLLLLTATPVQNSLEELYHLITLLQPGQFPPPREFRQRFIDKHRPRQPKEPDELRRLLNQVMIRNTRANAGLDLPPRRAQTILFEPGEAEAAFHHAWETDLRASLSASPLQYQSIRGRTLLQAIGSSPQAWRKSMQSYPDNAFSDRWLNAPAPFSVFDQKLKTLPALARAEGGLVVFTQFLATQEAIASALNETGTIVRIINGQTPPVERQPITDAFRRDGGILVLTRSGTEGRNLQFCRRLVNFDLPWNPMEIEQRIGRLHRIGQTHPVEIHTFVQAGSLQAMLLDLLQEKLNLFELVVGETGLILGDRFSSDDLGEEIFRCWQEAPDDVAGALARLGDAVAEARTVYGEIRELDSTLFANDYETV